MPPSSHSAPDPIEAGPSKHRRLEVGEESLTEDYGEPVQNLRTMGGGVDFFSSLGTEKKRKPKVLAGDEDSSSGKGDSGGQPMLRELPKEVRTLVNRANVFLRVILSLENAWTAEKKYGHEVLPEKHTILKRALGEVWGLKDDQGQPLKHVELAFGMLNTEKAHDLREAVFSLVRAWATVEPY